MEIQSKAVNTISDDSEHCFLPLSFPWAVKQTNMITHNIACFLSFSSLVSVYQGYQKHGLRVEYDPWQSSILIQFRAVTKKDISG